jgi:nucleotide-binding universal stress UspA family protein
MEGKMYRFNKLLIAVDFASTDHSLLEYAANIARKSNASQVNIIHTTENFEIPEEIKKKYPSIVEPLDEYARKRMTELAEQFFTAKANINIHVEVVEGEPVNSLLQYIKLNDIDLVFVGKTGSGVEQDTLGEKLARKAPCSVMIIPDGTHKLYKNIAAACDFSNHSIDALDVTHAFTESAGLKTFTCLHVYDVPTGYYKTGKSYEQFAEIMENNATHQFIAMMKLLDMKDVNPDLELVLNKKPARAIAEYVQKSGIDLLVMGARGRARGADILLGSITEQIIQSVNIPVLAVKKKGAGMDLLDVILNS